MRRITRMAPMLIVMGAIFFLSHQPGETYPQPLFPGEDKVAHLVIYGILAAAIIFAFAPETRREKRWLVVAVVILVSTFYGISDEFHQSFIPHRSTEVLDVVADFAGAAVVSLLWKIRYESR